MKKSKSKKRLFQQGVSSLSGIIILIVIALIIGAGVLAYKYYYVDIVLEETLTPVIGNQIPTTKKVSFSSLSDTTVIDAINKQLESGMQLEKSEQGRYYAFSEKTRSSHSVNLIVKGDLNSDSLQDAFVWGSVCGASCGSVFTVIINKGDSSVEAFNVIPDNFILSSAAQYSVKDISIENNGIVTIKAVIPSFDGSIKTENLNYKLLGKKLEIYSDQTTDIQ